MNETVVTYLGNDDVESENKELAEVRKELAEERAAMELYGAEGKPEEGLNTDTGVSGGPMNTISGVLLDPQNVKPDDIRLYDIAHPLSFICRGVWPSSALARASAILPISVSMPVATTTATPRP